MSREVILAFIDERKGEPMLEIGPLITPVLQKSNHNVYYADIKSKEEIYEQYKTYKSMDPPETLYERIMPIDYVVRDTYRDAVGHMRFSVVLSSHVIEHTTDLIGHLYELSEILTDDGLVVLFIPDKRYCFDHFREITPFRDAVDVYLKGEACCTARFVFEDCFNGYHFNNKNDPFLYWKNEISFNTVKEDDNGFTRARANYERSVNNGMVKGIHQWVFTDKSFLDIIRDCLRAKLIQFKLSYFSPTQPGEQEFHVILQKDLTILTNEAFRKQEVAKIAELAENLQSQGKEKDLQKLQIALQQKKQECDALSSRVHALENAFWWRATKPMRVLSTFVKRLLYRNTGGIKK